MKKLSIYTISICALLLALLGCSGDNKPKLNASIEYMVILHQSWDGNTDITMTGNDVEQLNTYLIKAGSQQRIQPESIENQQVIFSVMPTGEGQPGGIMLVQGSVDGSDQAYYYVYLDESNTVAVYAVSDENAQPVIEFLQSQ